MTNEYNEFLSYTAAPTYSVKSKKDNSFLGRFTMDMIMENYGFARIFAILARGYLFASDGDPYDRTELARRALCAWCSIPDKKNATPKAEWQYKSDFRELHGEFPKLVDENGGGWYYRHLHGIVDFINANRDKVGKSMHKIADNIEKLEDAWRKKVVQYQIPIFSEGTNGDLILRFDDVIADALELGALRSESIMLTESQMSWLEAITPKSVPLKVTQTLLEYYLANKPTDSDWCVFPITNIEAYLGSSALNKIYLKELNGTFMTKKENASGVSLYRII